MRDCIDSRVTQPKRVTSPPTWGPPPPCKQAFRIVMGMGIFPAMWKFFSLTFKWDVLFFFVFVKGCRAEYFFLDVKTILNYFISIDFSSVVAKSGLERHNLRWLDWIFWGWCLPSLSINYVGMSKDMEKRLLQLYYIKIKISYDLDFIAIGVAMAT